MKLFIVLALAAIVYSANGSTLNKRDAKNDQLTKAENIEKNVIAEIKKFKDAGKTIAVETLEGQLKTLQTLIAELKTAAKKDVGKIEKQLSAIEAKIAEEIRYDERTSAPNSNSTPAPTGTSRAPTGTSRAPTGTSRAPTGTPKSTAAV